MFRSTRKVTMRSALVLVSISLAVGTVGAPAAGAAAPPPGARHLAPSSLTTEHAHAPLDIDVPHPDLSWESSDKDDGMVQQAYRVVVATQASLAEQGIGDVWDS